MKLLTGLEHLQELSRAMGKPIIYVRIPDIPEVFQEYEAFVKELKKSAPFLFENGGAIDVADILTQGDGYVVCDNLDEMNRIYEGTVGPDGPTEKNLYSGPVRVYLLTSTGNENT